MFALIFQCLFTIFGPQTVVWRQCFFSPVNLEKVPVNNFAKVPVNIWSCPWTFEKNLAREPKKVSVNLKSAREHFQKKVPVNLRKVPVNTQIPAFLVLLRKKCPWTAKSAREHFQIFCPWTTKSAREKVPKSARERIHLPVNFLKKCPWTQNCAREHLRKNEVHGHFWCSRGEKKTLLYVLQVKEAKCYNLKFKKYPRQWQIDNEFPGWSETCPDNSCNFPVAMRTCPLFYS